MTRVLLDIFDTLAVGNYVYQFTGNREKKFISRLPLLENHGPAKYDEGD